MCLCNLSEKGIVFQSVLIPRESMKIVSFLIIFCFHISSTLAQTLILKQDLSLSSLGGKINPDSRPPSNSFGFFIANYFLFKGQTAFPFERPSEKDIFCELTITSLNLNTIPAQFKFKIIDMHPSIRYIVEKPYSILDIYFETSENELAYPSVLSCEKKLPQYFDPQDQLTTLQQVEEHISFSLILKTN